MRRISRALVLLALGAGLTGCEDDPTTVGPPAGIEVLSGNDQQGPVTQELPEPLVVRVVDEDDRPVSGAVVNFVVTRGGGTLFAATAQTDGEGVAQNRWTLGTVADSQRVEVRVGTTLVETFRAVGRPGTPAGMTAPQPARTGLPNAPLADSVAVVVRDPHGNPVPGVVVTWSVMDGGGSVSPATSTTDAQGVARARWTLGGSLQGQQTLLATAAAGVAATFTATATLGAGATFAIVGGDQQTGAVTTQLPQPLVVEVRQNGVPVQGVTVHWQGDGTLSGTTGGASVTDAQGRASATWTLGTAAGTRLAQATVPGAGLALGFQANATPGPPVRVWLPALDVGNARAGDVLNLRFGVVDAYDNLIPGATLHFAADSAARYGGGVSTATGQADATGWAYVEWTVPTQLQGRPTVQARMTATSPGAQPGYATASVLPGLEASMSFSLFPNPSPAGQWVRWFVSYTDAYGNPVTGFSATCATVVTAPPPGEVAGIYVRSPSTVTVTATCPSRGLTQNRELAIQ